MTKPLIAAKNTKLVNASGADSSKRSATGSGPRKTKLDQLVELLRKPRGATIAELAKETGWQPHSVRGAIAGALKKRGHAVGSRKVDGVRRYSLAKPE